MWTRFFLLSAFIFVAVWAAEPAAKKPTPCPAGTQYKKDCNICTCGTPNEKDKCSQIDCARAKASSTTARAPTGIRPGVCPTKVTPAPGNTDCKQRTQTSNCKVDKDCQGAKKCCENGCGLFLCRNAIYNYV